MNAGEPSLLSAGQWYRQERNTLLPLPLAIYGSQENWHQGRESERIGHVSQQLKNLGEVALYLTWDRADSGYQDCWSVGLKGVREPAG